MSTLGRYTAYVDKARELDLFVSNELNIPEEQSHRIIQSVLVATSCSSSVDIGLHNTHSLLGRNRGRS